MVRDADVIVVGGGPAGISAAWPMALAGLDVLVLDGGLDRPPSPPATRPPLPELRAAADGWRHLLGPNLSALRDVGYASPKLRTATPPGFGEDFTAANRLRPDGFRVVGALAPGGLSNVWGAVACAYGAADMADWPIGPEDLAASYRAVVERIGVSGSDDDDLAALLGAGLPLQPPLPVTGPAAELLARYRAGGAGITRLGHPRNAVLSRPLGERQACVQDKACMWGCGVGAVYNAAEDGQRLAATTRARLRTGILVRTLEQSPEGWRVLAEDRRSGEAVVLRAPRVVLAAGPLASTRMALSALGRVNEVRRLVTTPAFAFALVLPGRLGARLEEQGFGMAQLAFSRPLATGGDLFGLLYNADNFAVADMIAGMPLTRAGGLRAMGTLISSLVVGLAYLPGSYSDNRVRLAADHSLVVEGAWAPDFAAAMAAAMAGLAPDFRRLGAWVLPGSAKPFAPGVEVHYAGSLPMGGLAGTDGELAGAPGLHVADGAVLPSLPAKHHTLTVMANADRIGRLLAAKSP